jgi:hypothetical protein
MNSILEYLTDEQISELRAKVGEEQFRITFGNYETFDKDYGCVEGEMLSGDFIIDGKC